MSNDRTARLTFPKSHHIRRPSEFQATYRLKQRAGDNQFLIFAAPNGLSHCRLGMSVSKKSHGNAVRRNRIRRLIREAFRLEQHELPPGFDFIVVPRPQPDLRASLLPAYRRSLRRLAHKLSKRFADAPQ